MIEFSTIPEAPIQILKEMWGPISGGQEPWRRVIIKSRVMPGTSMAYNRSRGETLVVSLHDAVWDLRVVRGEGPHQVEEALRRGTPLLHPWRIVYHGWDVIDASRAFVRWCLP